MLTAWPPCPLKCMSVFRSSTSGQSGKRALRLDIAEEAPSLAMILSDAIISDVGVAAAGSCANLTDDALTFGFPLPTVLDVIVDGPLSWVLAASRWAARARSAARSLAACAILACSAAAARSSASSLVAG